MLTKVGWGVTVGVPVGVDVLVDVGVLVGVDVLVGVPMGVDDAATVGVDGIRVGVGLSSGPHAVINRRVKNDRRPRKWERVTFMYLIPLTLLIMGQAWT